MRVSLGATVRLLPCDLKVTSHVQILKTASVSGDNHTLPVGASCTRPPLDTWIMDALSFLMSMLDKLSYQSMLCNHKWMCVDVVTGLSTAFASIRRKSKVWRKWRRDTSPSSFFLRLHIVMISGGPWGSFSWVLSWTWKCYVPNYTVTKSHVIQLYVFILQSLCVVLFRTRPLFDFYVIQWLLYGRWGAFVFLCYLKLILHQNLFHLKFKVTGKIISLKT